MELKKQMALRRKMILSVLADVSLSWDDNTNAFTHKLKTPRAKFVNELVDRNHMYERYHSGNIKRSSIDYESARHILAVLEYLGYIKPAYGESYEAFWATDKLIKRFNKP